MWAHGITWLCAAATQPTPHLTRLSDAHQSSAPHRYHGIRPKEPTRTRCSRPWGKGRTTPSQTMITYLPLFREPLNEPPQRQGGKTIYRIAISPITDLCPFLPLGHRLLLHLNIIATTRSTSSCRRVTSCSCLCRRRSIHISCGPGSEEREWEMGQPTASPFMCLFPFPTASTHFLVSILSR